MANYRDFRYTMKIGCHENQIDRGCQCILLRGLYAFQLEPYIQHFPLNQSLELLAMEDIIGSLDKVC
jgi:hypothetical protein